MTDVNCRRCGVDINAQTDEWWSHRWDENPSEKNVEKALEDREFRDWFSENIILCGDCHKRVVEVINHND